LLKQHHKEKGIKLLGIGKMHFFQWFWQLDSLGSICKHKLLNQTCLSKKVKPIVHAKKIAIGSTKHNCIPGSTQSNK
jgi:hypothetical protein